MNVTKRVQGMTVAAAVLCSGAFVAGPATASPAKQVNESATSTGVKTAAAKPASSPSARKPARKIKCRLRISFRPRAGKGNKRILTAARTTCNVKVRKIWTSVQLRQTKAKNRYKISHTKRRARRNTTAINSFCPRQHRRYTIVGKTTVLLPKRANKKKLKLRKVGHQSGVCRA